jgi:Dullard-like phosphatase family protein
MFDDDSLGNEFNNKPVKSMKDSFHISELEQSAVLNSSDKDLLFESDQTMQLVDQDIRANEGGLHNLPGETSIVVLKDLISEVSVSPNSEDDSGSYNDASDSQLNIVNYEKEFANEDVKSSGHIFYAFNDHETSWGLNQGCSLLDSYNLDDSLPSLLDNPADLLPSYTGLFDELLPIDTLVNMSAKYGVFPLVESATEASIVTKPCSSEVDMCSINSEVLEWLNPHLSEDGLPELTDFTELDSNTASLSKEPWTRKVTLVLDLDETLVHSTMEHCDDADFTFSVFFDMKEHMVYVKKRPHVHMFLEKMAEMFEVVVFTASQSVYADQLLDMLDPEKELLTKRYFRESCIFTDRSYTKDLTVIGADLAKVAIIDNTPEVFQLQVNNGIPIESWYNDPSDEALPRLIPFLETLAVADDVRPIIAKKFGNAMDSC